MNPNTITAEERDAAAGSPAGPLPWHLALVSGTNGASLDAGLAALGSAPAGASPVTTPVTRRTVGAGPGTHRGAVLTGPEGPFELGAEETDATAAPLAFLFPDLGGHSLGMGRDLYRDFPVFRAEVDRCAELLAPELGLDIREVIFPPTLDPTTADPVAVPRTAPTYGTDLRHDSGHDSGHHRGPTSPEERRLNATRLAQPALFVIEYALAGLWYSWGARPAVLTGYGLGEYVAATLAGVLSLKDALTLVAHRAALIDALPPGAALAVTLPEPDVCALLGPHLSLSAVNGADSCVVAGPEEDIAALETSLRTRDVAHRRVSTTHAFHSRMMEPIADRLTELVRTLRLNAPSVPYLSNLTGVLVTDEQATDPGYWARHLLGPVRFADCLRAVGEDHVLLEAGPGRTLSGLAADVRGHATGSVVASMRDPRERRCDTSLALEALGRLWLAGGAVDWTVFPAKALATEGPTTPTTPAAPAVPTVPGPARTVEDGPSATEQELHALWARLLKTEELPRDVSFFEIGGTSLLASRLILRITRAFAVEPTLRQIYEWGTLTRTATAIDALRAGRDPQEALAGALVGALAGDASAAAHTGG
ncbi:acyltransferase domain-containing protein [Streptomyces sp. NPDC006430]|uniref:acyltransferase domain-containing protein n=1 Tax=Streptomyces sp. NPDC006430 TaxID=3154299 RepID=UPI0033A535F2